jgi:hypothetical protein
VNTSYSDAGPKTGQPAPHYSLLGYYPLRCEKAGVSHCDDTSRAWEASVLPLNYTRVRHDEALYDVNYTPLIYRDGHDHG